MALIDHVIDTEPANDAVGVPLKTTISITLSGLDYDEDSLIEGLFVEGPDTDQYIGPGLQLLTNPDNVSQGELDDFLQSPGYQGIVAGTVTVSGISGNTVVSFSSTKPFAATTDYVTNLAYVLASDGTTEVTGQVTLSFQTGSGSIEEIPSSISTSVLNITKTLSSSLSTNLPFKIIKVTPEDRSVENDITTKQIVIEFNKPIDPTSFSANDIQIITSALTDHPEITINAQGELAKTIEVIGNLLKINI